MDKWENTFEIDGMKFTVKCYCEKLDACFRYMFIAYNKNNEPVANTAIILYREPTIEDFEKEVVPPPLKKLQAFVKRRMLDSLQ